MSIACGERFTIFFDKHGRLFFTGELGIFDEPTRQSGKLCVPYLIEMPEKIHQVAAGRQHCAVVTKSRKLYMMGSSNCGQLGVGNENKDVPTLVNPDLFDKNEKILMADCGCMHTAVVTERGHVYSFGFGGHGQLGHGAMDEMPIASFWHDGKNSYTATVPTKVDPSFFNDEHVVLVSLGEEHSAMLTKEGNVYTCGDNGWGQLGHNDKQAKSVPTQINREYFNNKNVKFIAAGNFHMAAITEDDELYMWGCIHDYRIYFVQKNMLRPQLASVFGKVHGVACGVKHTLIIRKDEREEGSICGFGSQQFGQVNGTFQFRAASLKRLWVKEKFVAVAASDTHSAALTVQGTIWTWGSNAFNQLGHKWPKNLTDAYVRQNPSSDIDRIWRPQAITDFMPVMKMQPLAPVGTFSLDPEIEKIITATTGDSAETTSFLLRLPYELRNKILNNVDETREWPQEQYRATMILLGMLSLLENKK